jgi:hypothetical protein
MPDLESNFVIAITGMTIVCIVLIGFPLTLMLAKGVRERKGKRNLHHDSN